MTTQEAIKILDARSKCIERSVSGADTFCNNKECDNCELNYAQGTMGEQREALNMAITALGAIDQIRWERDVAIEQLNDLGYGLGEKPREEANNSNQEVKKSNQEVKKLSGLIERQKAIDLAHELIVPNEYKYGLYNQAINNYCVEIMQLPSAQPERKTGEWNFDGNQMFECTNCGVAYTEYQFEKMRVRYNDPKFPKFCPNYGSYNGGDSK